MKNGHMVASNIRFLPSIKTDVATKYKAKGFTLSEAMRRSVSRIAQREVAPNQKQQAEKEVQVAFRVLGDDLDLATAYAKECGMSLKEMMLLAIESDPLLQ